MSMCLEIGKDWCHVNASQSFLSCHLSSPQYFHSQQEDHFATRMIFAVESLP
jgi:hypothetical protein